MELVVAALEELMELFGRDNGTIQHVPREQNSDADKFATKAIKTKATRTLKDLSDTAALRASPLWGLSLYLHKWFWIVTPQSHVLRMPRFHRVLVVKCQNPVCYEWRRKR